MITEQKMNILRTAKLKGYLTDKMLRGASPEQIEEINSLSDSVAVAPEQTDVSEERLLWEGMKAGIPEVYYGGKQLGYHTAEKLGMDIAPETMKRVDREANQFNRENKYDLMGEAPDKKSFGYFNPYRTGKILAQTALPLRWLAPKKANLMGKGVEGFKDRAKFGAKVGGLYGTVLPTEGGENYWEHKLPQSGFGALGGIVGGEIFNALVRGGVGAMNLGRKGVNLVSDLVAKIQRGESLPPSISQLDATGVRDVSREVQVKIQSILDQANRQGGVITPEQAKKIAMYEGIGYETGTKGAAKYPHEPLTPAQVKQDPAIAAEELMLEGNPLYKQKMRDQQQYMTGSVEKVSEKLQGKPLTGEAGYPSARATGEEVAGVADAMSGRLRAKTGRIYSQATKEYGKARVKPVNFMRAVKSLENKAIAADVNNTAKGYAGQVRDAMNRQVYKGQKGTMKTDMWSSSAGKLPPQPKADSLNVASLEGIRKNLTAQVAQLERGGNKEGARVLRDLRNALDKDVAESVGHDVYKVGRSAHEVGMKTLDIPVVNKVLQGKYNDDFAKIVDDAKKMPYEQLLKLKKGMYSEGDKGQQAWQRMAAQIWHDMKEAGIRGYEGHGQGRNVSIPAIETQLKQFGKSARGLGANSEKGKLLFGEDIANEINNIMKLSRDLEIMGAREVRTGWGGLVNLLDWGSRLLGRVPSVQARGASSLAQGTKKAIEEGAKTKFQQKILDRTLQGPLPPPQGRSYLRGFGIGAGGVEGAKRKRGGLSP